MNDEAKGLVFGLIGVIVFGLTLPATRVAVAEFSPVMIGIGRAVITPATLAFAVFVVAIVGIGRNMRIERT